MKKLAFGGVVLGLVTLCGLFGVGLAAQDTKLQAKDLPAPVLKSAQAELAKGGKLVGYLKDVEDGKTYYEMETTISGHTRDFQFDPSGKLLEVEEEMATSAVPPAAVKAIAAKGTPGKIESVTKNGVIVAYESIVKTKAGKSLEVAVDATGKTVTP
jgi:uncharacterized membrane protein YkoI